MTYPEECCGLFLGIPNDDHKIVQEIWPTQNSWQDSFPELEHRQTIVQLNLSKRNRFSIAPQEMLQAQKEARSRHLDIIGIYHSHPDHPAIPSEFDRAIAWSEYSYIIVSVEKGQANELLSWKFDQQHLFQPEIIVTLDSNPPNL
jgi:proteasome lid subunit RPN8/RPN11